MIWKSKVSIVLMCLFCLLLMGCAGNGYQDQVDHHNEKSFYRDLRFLEKSAEAGNADSQYKAALLYRGGVRPSSPKNAMKWMEIYASKGNASVQYNLGMAYYLGEIVSPDIKKSTFWFELSAYQNNLESIKLLDSIYAEDYPDQQRRFYWVNRGASLGDAYLQCTLGDMYASGDGVNRDNKKVLYWYNKSADQNVQDSAYAYVALGKLYREGIIAPKNMKKSEIYFSKASSLGVPSEEFQNNSKPK